MFTHYKFNNNIIDNCFLKAFTLMFQLFSFLISSFAQKKLIITHFFKKLIYETQSFASITSDMWILIMWYRFSEDKNKTVVINIPQNGDLKTRKPHHRDSKTKQMQHQLKHYSIKKQRKLIHDIVIPRHFFRGQKVAI